MALAWLELIAEACVILLCFQKKMLMHVLSLGSVGSFGSCAQQLQVVTCKKGREEQDKRLVGGLSPIS